MGQRPPEKEPLKRSELTRMEYLQLLSAAKTLKNERLYLVIKMFVCTGIKISQLQKFTVEDARSGKTGSSSSAVEIPDILQKELLRYAAHEDISSGILFRTRYGGEMDRSNVCHQLKDLSVVANVEPEKCNPRSLIYLYRDTQQMILESMRELIRQAGNQLLEREQNMIESGF